MKVNDMIKKNTLVTTLLLFSISYTAFAQKDSLRIKISNIIRPLKAEVGVAIKLLEGNDTLSINGKKHFPMQSVFKFPQAMAVLHQVDLGKLSMDQKIGIAKKDIFPTHSPLAKKYPEGNADVPLSELLYATVSVSDNVGCDILFRLIGGCKTVDKYIHDLGIKDIAIAHTEKEMHAAWDVQFKNWSTPLAMTQLLEILYNKKKLSAESHNFLWRAMVESPTGPRRIKGLLPKETVVAHKTGTGNFNDQGVLGAVNDVGIINLPNGKHLVVVIFISRSTEKDTRLEDAMAEIAKAVYQHYQTQ
jgi:beta-lactamase class A